MRSKGETRRLLQRIGEEESVIQDDAASDRWDFERHEKTAAADRFECW